MKRMRDPLKPNSPHAIARLIDRKWKPYKIFGNDYREIIHQNEGRKVMNWAKTPNRRDWVLLQPVKGDEEKIAAYEQIKVLEWDLQELLAKRTQFETKWCNATIFNYREDQIQYNKDAAEIKVSYSKIFQKECNKIKEHTEFIDPLMHDPFIKAEKKALGNIGKFNNIRCAAFCELLYSKKYIINTKTRQKTMSAFAQSRYGIDISKALATSKKFRRDSHKTKKIKGQNPLKNCF